MKQRPRIDYNESQKATMWDRWRGVALHVNLDKMPELRRETFTV